MKWNSVHDYLDDVFADLVPDREMVIQAKKDYWRLYNTNLKRNRRLHYREFSVWFSPMELEMLYSKMGKGIAVSQFIRKEVLIHLHGDMPINEIIDTAVIEQQLFLIRELLTELLEIGMVMDVEVIQKLTLKIQRLQLLIENSFDNQK